MREEQRQMLSVKCKYICVKKKKKWNDGMVDSIVISCIVGPNGTQGNECLPNTKDLELK